MKKKNKLDDKFTLDNAANGLLRAESANENYLAQLRKYGLIDKDNQITERFVDSISAFVTLPLYKELTEVLDIPIDVVIIKDLLDMLVEKKAEHAIFVLFELIYSFTKTPMPQALDALTKNGMMLDFAGFFLADLTEIIKEEFDSQIIYEEVIL